MSSAHVRLTLRIVGVLIVASGVIAGVRGGVSFSAQPETVSSDTYVIHHTLILPHTFVALAVFGAVLFGASFFVRGRARGT